MSREVLLMVAPNGARRTKADHPALPIAPRELAAEAAACREAGAAAIHLHVRDAAGAHSLEPALYAPAIEAVRAAAPDMAIQITTEAVGRYGPAEQMACVRALVPQGASLALSELAPDDAEETLMRLRGFLRWMRVMEVWPQFILYSPQEAARFAHLQKTGVIPQKRPFVLFVLGRYGQEAPPSPQEAIADFTAALGEDAEWAVCAFGPAEARAALAAARAGGHVRIGFENNMMLPGGGRAASNAELVAATAELLRAEGFAPMSPAALRRLMAATT